MSKTIIITGSAGLIGSEASRFFAKKGYDIVGIDNDMRATFFGEEASTEWSASQLKEELGSYDHRSVDIRENRAIQQIFEERREDISAVIHTAAQPSHDWAAKEPLTDFGVNANGTLNLLEAFRIHSPRASFIFTSTNKVYGDRPNMQPLVEDETRYELYDGEGKPSPGIDESMPLDQCLHSLFGVSKLAADLLVQEYGRYFGLDTVCFRGGCLTGGGHSGAELHGFLSYLMRCVITGKEYQIYGYKGKQVRDNIHSSDLVRAFDEYLRAPRPASVYNIGGGRHSNCSMLEAIQACEYRSGKRLRRVYDERTRIGDHQWYISDLRRFKKDYPEWELRYSINEIYDAVYEGMLQRV
jgi:CDP-paratose 2-epimerase